MRKPNLLHAEHQARQQLAGRTDVFETAHELKALPLPEEKSQKHSNLLLALIGNTHKHSAGECM